jgi:hypothetical protein
MHVKLHIDGNNLTPERAAANRGGSAAGLKHWHREIDNDGDFE